MKRRSFSGKSSSLSEDQKKANVSTIFGLAAFKAPKNERYEVRKGESLRSIAQKLYGDGSYWVLLALKNCLSTKADRNGVPIVHLERGQVLRLPDSYDEESFALNPEAPNVVALIRDESGLLVPRTRVCPHCDRETLAMAIGCVSCLEHLDIFADTELDEDEKDEAEYEHDYEQAPGRVVPTRSGNSISSQDAWETEEDDDEEEDGEDRETEVAAKLEHERGPSLDQLTTITRSPFVQIEPAESNKAGNLSPRQSQDQTVVSDLRPPRQDFTVVQSTDLQSQTVLSPGQAGVSNKRPPDSGEAPLAAESSGDPFWTPIERPEMLDSSVRVIESRIEGDLKGLRIVLQLFIEDQWVAVYEYHVFNDDVIIVQHHRIAGRRRQKKSLPARQTKKMAWNHYRRSWQGICQDFWSN